MLVLSEPHDAFVCIIHIDYKLQVTITSHNLEVGFLLVIATYIR